MTHAVHQFLITISLLPRTLSENINNFTSKTEFIQLKLNRLLIILTCKRATKNSATTSGSHCQNDRQAVDSFRINSPIDKGYSSLYCLPLSFFGLRTSSIPGKLPPMCFFFEWPSYTTHSNNVSHLIHKSRSGSELNPRLRMLTTSNSFPINLTTHIDNPNGESLLFNWDS